MVVAIQRGTGKLLLPDERSSEVSMGFPEDAPRAVIEQSQREELVRVVVAVSNSNPFWQAKFRQAGWSDPTEIIAAIQNGAEIGALPLCTKAELVADQEETGPYGTNLTVPLEEFNRLHQTSGTTGQPLRWLDSQANWDRILDTWAQIFRIAGVQSSDRFCFPFSFGPFIGFWAAFEGAVREGHLCLSGGGMSSEMRLRVIEKNMATVVCCTPTYALRLAEVACAKGLNLVDGSVRMLIVAGEPGGSVPAIRSAIEEAWGARVIDHWGMTEIGPAAVECVECPGGMHVLETECIAEVLDPETLEPVTTNQTGELVLTTLGRVDSPVLRFRTGDLVERREGECACGRSLLWLSGGIKGRTDEMITIRGNNLFPSSLEALLREIPGVVEFRVTVRSENAMDQVVIEVEPDGKVKPESLVSQVVQRCGEQWGFRIEVVAVETGSLPRFEMKGRRFVRVDDREKETGQ